jgi:hypothetical protein
MAADDAKTRMPKMYAIGSLMQPVKLWPLLQTANILVFV